jgi:glycosyltransferase involved in cell wall biosynthesis
LSASNPPAARPRLLAVAPSAYPFGGVADWLDGLVTGLRARGWPLDVALLAGDHHDVDRYLERHPLGDVERVVNRTGSREGRPRALARAIADSAAELVLAVNVGDIEEAVDRVRHAGRRSLRLVTTQHALQADYFAHLRARSESVDGVVVTNRLGVALAERCGGLERERIAYAPYGVDATTLAPARAGGPPLGIVWAGRLARRQKRAGDLPAICSALERHGVAYRLEIAGAGPDEARLREALAGRLESGAVRFLGALPRERLRAEAYGRAEVLLVTSDWETGPIVAWEALVAGAAIVSTAYLGSGAEGALRPDETALFFPVGDADAAAQALGRATDPELRRRLVAAGQREVATRYTLSASLDAWESALLRFASLPPRPAREARPPAKPSGRLDRWLDAPAAELLRGALPVRRRQRSAGAEWPHALATSTDESTFRELALAADRPPPAAAEAPS